MAVKARKEAVEAMKPVKIYTAGDRVEAEMLLEALHRNHIQGFREAPGSGGAMDVYTGNSIYGEKIYVDELDASRAMEIIESVLPEAELSTAPGDEIPKNAQTLPRWVTVGFLTAMIAVIGTTIVIAAFHFIG